MVGCLVRQRHDQRLAGDDRARTEAIRVTDLLDDSTGIVTRGNFPCDSPERLPRLNDNHRLLLRLRVRRCPGDLSGSHDNGDQCTDGRYESDGSTAGREANGGWASRHRPNGGWA